MPDSTRRRVIPLVIAALLFIAANAANAQPQTPAARDPP